MKTALFTITALFLMTTQAHAVALMCGPKAQAMIAIMQSVEADTPTVITSHDFKRVFDGKDDLSGMDWETYTFSSDVKSVSITLDSSRGCDAVQIQVQHLK